MRRIAQRHTMIDERGYAWEVEITVPWDGATGQSHGPDGPLVTIQTPNDPEHWAYGEPGPTFDLSYLQTVVGLAIAHAAMTPEVRCD
jgi:hypothetical protein